MLQKYAEVFSEIESMNIIITRDQIIDRLSDRCRWPTYYTWMQPSAEVIKKDGSKIHSSLYDDDGYVNSEKIINYYNEGYTILLSNIGNLLSEFRPVQNTLNKFFRKNININLYAGSGNKSVSFPSHDHDYDVLVKNISGKSYWELGKENIYLNNQNILFIPKYTKHSVRSIEGEKISLTCNLDASI